MLCGVRRKIWRNDEDVIVDPDIDGGDHGRVWDVNTNNCPTVLVDLNSEVSLLPTFSVNVKKFFHSNGILLT